MRVFTLVNSENKSIDITTKELFFHEPSGLGYDYSYDFRQVGNRYVAVNRNMSQKSITGKVALLGEDPYLQYFNLVRFLSKTPLILKYTPNNQGKGEESRTVYNLDVVVQKLEKTELEKAGYLSCGVTFQALGPWYEEIIMDRGNISNTDSYNAKHKLIWSSTTEETVDGDKAMEWANSEKQFAETKLPSLRTFENENSDWIFEDNKIYEKIGRGAGEKGSLVMECVLNEDDEVKYVNVISPIADGPGLNLIEPKMESASYGGVTFTNNGDGSFTINGTATEDADFHIDQSTYNGHDNLKTYSENVGNTDYIVTGLADNVELHLLYAYVSDDTYYYDPVFRFTNVAKRKHLNTDVDNCCISIEVKNGVTYDNVTIKPLLANSYLIPDEWEPYENPHVITTEFSYPVWFIDEVAAGKTYTIVYNRKCNLKFTGSKDLGGGEYGSVEFYLAYDTPGEPMPYTLDEEGVEWGHTVMAEFRLSKDDQVLMAPTITNEIPIGGSIKFSDDDESSNGIFADTSIENPSRLTIYGPSTGGFIEWTHYVNGKEYSTGKINGIDLAPDECVVIDNISVPGLIYKKNLISGAMEDLYSKSDFTTVRFVTLQNGVNTVIARSAYAELNFKWEARLQYESV